MQDCCQKHGNGRSTSKQIATISALQKPDGEGGGQEERLIAYNRFFQIVPVEGKHYRLVRTALYGIFCAWR